MKQPKKNKSIALIKKANNLIEARYKFDIWEMRFFLTLLSRINRGDTDSTIHRIWYKDVIKTFGLKTGQSYDLLRTGVKGVMERSMYINIEDENGFVREHRYNIVSYANTLVHAPDGKDASSQEFVDVKIVADAKPLLLELQKNFTYYDLSNVTQLGVYAIRIYELLKQYQNIGERTLKITDIKQMFEIKNEYPRYSNFYQKVIKPAINEINKHTDLQVYEPEKVKEGRSVEALFFKFHRKSNIILARDEEDKEHSETFFSDDGQSTNMEMAEVVEIVEEPNRKDSLYLKFEEVVVRNFGVTPSVFMHLLRQYDSEQIEQAIRVVRRARVNGQIKTNISGFFIQALKAGYTDTKEEQEKKKLSDAQKQQKQAEIAREKANREIEKGKLINDKIRALLAIKPNLTIQAIENMKTQPLPQTMINIKEKQLGRPLQVEDYRQDEFLREAVKVNIIELEKAEFEEIFKRFDKP
jgi:plasmid replication initiation protein